MPDLSRHYEKAEKLLQKGKIAAALHVYESVLEEDPKDERARESAADLCFSLNENGRGLELLESLFRDYVSVGNATKAAHTFKKLARLGRPVIELLMGYGEMMEGTNKKDAIEAYELAIKHLPAEQGLAAIGRIVALDPKPENHKRQAELASAAGERQFAAQAYLRFALELQRANFDPSEAYESAYKEDPENSAARLGYGRALAAQEQHEEAVRLLEPLAKPVSAPFEAREPYAKALLALGRTLDVEPFVWELFEHDPQQHGPTVAQVIGALLDRGDSDRALALARKLDDFQRRAGKRREFVELMRGITDKHKGNIRFLEYLAELYDGSNREADYCAVLGVLFDLYYASGNFIKAFDSLERAVDVDSYEASHHDRLARLQGRVDSKRLSGVATKLGIAVDGAGGSESQNLPVEAEAAPTADGSTVLEDLVLQAEIFLQYSMRTKALEKIERIHKLFPREEQNNYRLRELYNNAGFFPRYSESVPTAPISMAATSQIPPIRSDSPDAIVADDLARSAEVNRNIARQANVKSVLFAAVNDVGRNWNASRCIAGLCTPGKPPSAVIEYCAPGVKPCDVTSIVKMVMGTQPICAAHGGVAVAFSNTQGQPELQPLADVLATHGVASLLAIPMLEADLQVGVLLLMQSGGTRNWRQSEIAVLRTVSDQMVLAINNARLRSLVKTLAVTDEKSGLLKRSSYLDVLLSEVRRARQQQTALTLLLLQVGKPSLARELEEPEVEAMMQHVGQLITSHTRQNDTALRYSDTQVALLFSDTDEKSAGMAVEKLRRVLSVVRIPGKDKAPTVTAGIAEIVPVAEYDPEDVVTEAINRVEQALTLARTGSKTGVLALPPMQVTMI